VEIARQNAEGFLDFKTEQTSRPLIHENWRQKMYQNHFVLKVRYKNVRVFVVICKNNVLNLIIFFLDYGL